MGLYKKVDTELDFALREQNIIDFWDKEKIFQKSIENRCGCESFVFFDGPPTANGKPHIGHVLTRAVKDIIPRYKTMKGFKVLRKAGWDTHGLPVELEVEKELGINGKPEIEKYGVGLFNEKCKESVWKYKTEWEKLSKRVAFWADMDNPYVTYHNEYIESVWWALRQIWDKGLLYKGHKIVPYCPRCGTALSSHEVAQGYKDVKDTSVFVKFKVSGKNEYFLAWTTTPWTLPSNVALCVNAKETYAKVELNGETYIMAAALAESVLGKEAEIKETCCGSDLEKIKYEPLFDFAAADNAHYITCDDYVTLSDGTGIVHIAPAFGEDDARVGRKYSLPFVQLVNEQGKFVEAAAPWAGIFVKKADPLIIKNLKERGLLYKELNFEHSYPFCWRCDTMLIYYARDTWFIETTKIKKDLLKNNDKINWMPDSIRTGRFGNFLENLIDWGLSRERYWGTPLPIWECGCGHRHLIGSVAELKELGTDVPDTIELHKPHIDNVHVKCPKCGGGMKRVSEVIDCWFDSGSMPFAQWHYPFENKEMFGENFPADFISEAIDQTRGWFYSLLAISTLLFDKPPFENVIVLGHIQDKNGLKLSKSKGNMIDPWETLEKHGADAVRWYFYVSSALWLSNKFSDENVSDAARRFMGTFWNSYAFYVLYANIDDFNPAEHTLEREKLPAMDRWILSKLNTLVEKTDKNLEAYKITESARLMTDFVDELSNWYVRRCRERFWAKGMEQDKINAYMTLYTVLTTVAKLSAPFTPFISEEIYKNLTNVYADAPKSVHLCDFPVADSNYIDNELENNMDTVLKIVVCGRAARNKAVIKNRQPLAKMLIKAENSLSGMYTEIIADELNVKHIEFTDQAEGYVSYKFKPQLRTLGKKYGGLLPKIGEWLGNNDGLKLMAELKKNGEIKFDIDQNEVVLTEEDVIIESAQLEGYAAESDRGVTVVLETTLTDDLIEEGNVREIISKIQTMRKETDFNVTDRITLYHNGNENIAGIIERNQDEICGAVLAEKVIAGTGGISKDWNVNGENVVFGVEKI